MAATGSNDLAANGSTVDTRIRDFLHVFELQPGKRLWHGGPSLFGSLRGVSAEQAAWHAPGHAHSIWQLVLHCAYSRYNVRRLFEGGTERGGFPRQGAYWPKLPEKVNDASWREDKALLRAEHERLVDAVSGFRPSRLADYASQQWRYIDLLWGIVMHDMLHVGELQVLKRLYELRAGA
jgi:hypothetical protein